MKRIMALPNMGDRPLAIELTHSRRRNWSLAPSSRRRPALGQKKVIKTLGLKGE
jgi:hypothetical protein